MHGSNLKDKTRSEISVPKPLKIIELEQLDKRFIFAKKESSGLLDSRLQENNLIAHGTSFYGTDQEGNIILL